MTDNDTRPRCNLKLSSGLRIAAAALATAAALAAAAQDVDEKVYEYPDDTFITVNGEVESVQERGFILDFGEGEVLVAMDDGTRDPEAPELLEGDKVSVSGIVDDDLFDRRTIEAAGVYVERLGITLGASSVDEDDEGRGILELPRVSGHFESTVHGRVTEVDESAEEFTLRAGTRTLNVKLDQRPTAVLGDEYPGTGVEVGDLVQVTGRIEDDFFRGREMIADVVEVIDNQ